MLYYRMCGIAGIFNVDGRPSDREVLARMAAAIAHRGPDGERFYFDDASGIGFAHRHLRIIDLSDAALQPMCNEDGSLWLIYNGEIYNYVELRPELEARGHRFSSHSDSETILHAYEEWGPDCLQRFNGMFAFALWDSHKRSLFIARDRVGVKPLYYWWRNGTLAFASEIKALLQHPGITVTPYLPAVAQYMSAMYTVGEQTWFAGINRLLPGHYMVVTPDGINIRQWWDLPATEDAPGAHPEQHYVKQVRELLEDSVRLRLRSDVALGSHLSGGIDSSAIVALLSNRLAKSGERVRTFSGAFADGPGYDERKYVRQVVHRYKTDHRETIPTAADLPRLLERMVTHMDEPAAGPGILLQWAVCDLTKRSGVIVVNGGQGGDEAWGGYFGYIPAYLQTLVKQARRHPALYAELLRDTATLARRPVLRRSLVNALRTRRRGRLQVDSELGEWAGERFKCESADLAQAAPEVSHTPRTPLADVMYYDLKWYLPALLQVEDRTSMAFGLESRAPLLDYRLLELSASVPASIRMEGLQMKHVLRDAVKDLLPPSIYNRTDKKGMPTPIAPWFRGELAAWVESTLTSPQTLATGLFSPEYVRQALRTHQAGQKDASLELWKMLNVVTWWKVFIES
ncbi:MAG TPA: asparagine synthase (glutamine-hydrolyzing) [Chloroflexia bacterium]|nr:asparagine synthase (glutamine-hydrolyzing) [Chloroflexia bacterium]